MPAPVRPAEPAGKPASIAGTYEVKNGDTLAKIAGKSKSAGVSLDQMLVALYRNNQDAFINGNINRLKSGVILNIPDQEAAGSVAPDDAHRLVIAQASDWKAYQDKVAGGVQAAPAAPVEKPRQESKGRITAKVEDQSQKAQARDQLKLSKAADAAAKADAKKGARTRAAEEDVIAKDRALKEANSRDAELEKNLRDLQKLVELKNQNLADLQKQAAAKASGTSKADAKAEAKAVAAAKAAEAKAAAEKAAADKAADAKAAADKAAADKAAAAKAAADKVADAKAAAAKAVADGGRRQVSGRQSRG